MPKCSVRLCKNNTKTVKKRDGISYFHFPVQLIQKEMWRKIIAQERRDEFFLPNRSSVVCSDHFSDSDMYFTTKGIRRLKRDAVPVVDTKEDAAQTQGSGGTSFEANTDSKSKDEETSTARREVAEALAAFKEAAPIRIPGITSEQRASSPVSSGLAFLFNSPKTTNYYKKSIRDSIEKNKIKTNFIKNLQLQNRRLKKRNESLKCIIQGLKGKRVVRVDGGSNEQQNSNESPPSVLTSKKTKTLASFSPALRKFALTVHSYSPEVYNYLRSIFKNRIPHPNNIFKWYRKANSDSETGLTEETMARLAEKAKTSTEPLLCAMVIEEIMSQRDQEIWIGTQCED